MSLFLKSYGSKFRAGSSLLYKACNCVEMDDMGKLRAVMSSDNTENYRNISC